MSALELARLVQQVRDAQRSYFKTRAPAALTESKRLEGELDRTVRAILTPPHLTAPTLFDEPPASASGGG